jgi:hypothetical protein
MKYSATIKMIIVPMIVGLVATAQTGKNSRPGDEPYTPTKLEWAAVELQGQFGINDASNVSVSYMAGLDGKTMKCLLTYPSDFSVGALKTIKDGVQKTFKRYTAMRGWTWMRLETQEDVIHGAGSHP